MPLGLKGGFMEDRVLDWIPGRGQDVNGQTYRKHKEDRANHGLAAGRGGCLEEG